MPISREEVIKMARDSQYNPITGFQSAQSLRVEVFSFSLIQLEHFAQAVCSKALDDAIELMMKAEDVFIAASEIRKLNGGV
jgi:hypothetical protein